MHLLFFMTHMFLVPTGEAGMWPVSIKKMCLFDRKGLEKFNFEFKIFLQTNTFHISFKGQL